MNPKPSIGAILWNDWPALATSLGLVIPWVLYFGYRLLDPSAGSDPVFAWLATASTLAMLPLLGWRIRRVLVLFARGVEVPAHITSIHLFKDRGRIDYAFTLGEGISSSWCPVHKTARVLAFKLGEPVKVLVNPANPKQSILKALYVEA